MAFPYSVVAQIMPRRKIMKAIVCTKYGLPDVLELQDVKKPTPKNNEVLIRIHATAVTASDCLIRKFNPFTGNLMGLVGGLVIGFTKPRSSILGGVLAGDVEVAGRAVTQLKAGDQVFSFTTQSALQPRFGTYAEYM